MGFSWSGVSNIDDLLLISRVVVIEACRLASSQFIPLANVAAGIALLANQPKLMSNEFRYMQLVIITLPLIKHAER